MCGDVWTDGSDTAAIIAGCLAVPLALLWLLFRCFNDWHKRQCKQEIGEPSAFHVTSHTPIQSIYMPPSH